MDPELPELLEQAKRIATQYQRLTGRPLGITGQVAEHEAARLLGLDLAPVRQPGYDAVRRTTDGEYRLQIKSRCVLPTSRFQRVPRVDSRKDWDGVLLVLMDEHYNTTAIYEAARTTVLNAQDAIGTKGLPVKKFIAIGRQVWPNEEPPAHAGGT